MTENAFPVLPFLSFIILLLQFSPPPFLPTLLFFPSSCSSPLHILLTFLPFPALWFCPPSSLPPLLPTGAESAPAHFEMIISEHCNHQQHSLLLALAVCGPTVWCKYSAIQIPRNFEVILWEKGILKKKFNMEFNWLIAPGQVSCTHQGSSTADYIASYE